MRGTFKVNRTFWLPEQGAEPTVQSSTIKRVHLTSSIVCHLSGSNGWFWFQTASFQSIAQNAPIERSDSLWLSMNVR